MATYNSLVSRTDAGPLIPEDAAAEIIKEATEGSAIMRMVPAAQVRRLSRAQHRIPVLSVLPTAYFVSGDTGLKQTTEQNWKNVYINIEELAAIVPIPEAVIADADYDLWGEIRPSIAESIGAAFDAAVLYGTNAPASWPDDLLTQMVAAGHTVELGSVGTDLYDDLLDETGVLSLIEEDGYMASGHLAALSMRARLRGLRDTAGQPLFTTDLREAQRYALDGEPLDFPRNGAFDPTETLLVSGDWSKIVLGIRQDLTWKVITEGVITDADGAIVYNLPQQDMAALRVTFRVGWALPNPENRINTDDTTRLPFAALVPATS